MQMNVTYAISQRLGDLTLQRASFQLGDMTVDNANQIDEKKDVTFQEVDIVKEKNDADSGINYKKDERYTLLQSRKKNFQNEGSNVISHHAGFVTTLCDL